MISFNAFLSRLKETPYPLAVTCTPHFPLAQPQGTARLCCVCRCAAHGVLQHGAFVADWLTQQNVFKGPSCCIMYSPSFVLITESLCFSNKTVFSFQCFSFFRIPKFSSLTKQPGEDILTLRLIVSNQTLPLPETYFSVCQSVTAEKALPPAL